eukprot:CAMPEP_0180535208 /NCGR_PEP_ID=MMETSP1036_2-20121128/64603_1 /TAXON_ID=632150 /ORGANISM="Azadinium spinosum, Strain 3D9" /LENGTH=67 /DNA_ID=CAMNT_0022549607 /DNA_START=281 /DNA_END=483 /DNA_ORIENTATION=-
MSQGSPPIDIGGNRAFVNSGGTQSMLGGARSSFFGKFSGKADLADEKRCKGNLGSRNLSDARLEEDS